MTLTLRTLAPLLATALLLGACGLNFEPEPPEPGNSPPTLVVSADLELIRNNLAPRRVEFDLVASDPDGDPLELTVAAAIDSGVTLDEIVAGCDAGGCRVAFTPRADGDASTLVTLTVRDGRGGLAEGAFTLTLAPHRVTSAGDRGPGTLRQLLADAAPGDVIAFAADLAGTITLDSELALERSVTVEGPGAELLALSGGDRQRVLRVAGVQAELSGLTLRDGRADRGGAVLNHGTLTLRGVVISDSHATGAGGGVASDAGQLTLLDSEVARNRSDGRGGGLAFASSSGFVGADSTVGNNVALLSGGGIHLDHESVVEVHDSEVVGNWSQQRFGGGIESSGSLTVLRSRIAENQAIGRGAGVGNYAGSLLVESSEIVGNRAIGDEGGGGLYIAFSSDSHVEDTLIANNRSDRSGAGAMLHGSTVTMAGVRFEDNHAREGSGGGLVVSEGTFTLSETDLIGNSARSGGGIAIFYGGAGRTTSFLLDGGEIRGNRTNDRGRGEGGGVWNFTGGTVLRRVTVADNEAEFGAGIYNTASIYGGGEITLEESVVTGNLAGVSGGGIYNNDPTSNALLNATTVASNDARERGGGIYNDGAALEMDGASLVTGNGAGVSGGGVFFESGSMEGGVVEGNAPDDVAVGEP
jgi:hypothetical protein